MSLVLFVLELPQIFALVRCRPCRATVRVRWPERGRRCDRCGEMTAPARPPRVWN